jgi:hypothetical protein
MSRLINVIDIHSFDTKCYVQYTFILMEKRLEERLVGPGRLGRSVRYVGDVNLNEQRQDRDH